MHNFFRPQIDQAAIAAFANEKVNLKLDKANEYRAQVRVLREHLDRYISEHPDTGLEKMLLSGSLAKGTALRTLNDVDVAVYVRGGDVPSERVELLQWLVERLRITYHQMSPQKIDIDGPCIVLKFATGIAIEVVPVFYEGDPQDRGYIWDRATNEKILTSIPLHIEFIRKRKKKQPVHFRQVIRLLKWWANQRKVDTEGFTLRMFLVELIIAKLADEGSDFSDYHRGLETFFLYIQKTGLTERIAFSDNYAPSELPSLKHTVEIFDPVNPRNNVASDLTDAQRNQIVSCSADALDALAYARSSTTKGDALECWKDLMGASFNA
jgi:tRNA nucleotidyltransferase (CCA-adding enzyme)